jgi:DNA polymerase-1
MSNEVLDEAGVLAKFGVPAERIVDYLALIGDAVDNVPGVDKVGAKTAVKWLAQYGSLDGVIAAAADIGGVVGQNLRRALDFLPLARRLVTVRCDLELPLARPTCAPRPRDRERLIEIFSHYEMRSWLKEVQGGGRRARRCAAGAATAGQALASEQADLLPTTRTARPTKRSSTSAFERWLAKIDAAPLTALDTETTSLDPFAARIVGVSLAVAPGEAAYLPLAHHYPGAPDAVAARRSAGALQPWLESARTPRSARTSSTTSMCWPITASSGRRRARHAAAILRPRIGKDGVRGTTSDASRPAISGWRRFPTKRCAARAPSQIGFDQVAIEQAAEYAAEDADLCLRLHARLYPQIAADAGSGAGLRGRSKCRCATSFSAWSVPAC